MSALYSVYYRDRAGLYVVSAGCSLVLTRILDVGILALFPEPNWRP